MKTYQEEGKQKIVFQNTFMKTLKKNFNNN